jgi:glycosyltransferase XagB
LRWGPVVAFGGAAGAAVRQPWRKDWLVGDPLQASVGLSRPHGSRVARRVACPELDCIRHLLPDRILAAAERRAQKLDVGAERVLICAGEITEQAYVTALARSLGTAYERFEGVTRADCPLDDNQLLQAAAAGLLPLRRGRDLVWIIAPRNLTARRLTNPRSAWSRRLRPFRLTSADHLQHFVMRHSVRTLGHRATNTLHMAHPLMSNAPNGGRGLRAMAIMLLLAVFFALAPAAMIATLSAACCAIFLAAALLRLLSACFTDAAAPCEAQMDDARLPIYTVICALYREARVVRDLVAGIRALDYPPEKLDVKIVLEADDHETRRAFAGLNLGPPFEIIIAPPFGPRTKPKALNAALPLARGAYTVVFDAEDAPEPDQLRSALEIFRKGDHRLACVQASLSIYNTADHWLARMFTANYAGHFDVFLPGLAALHLPLPLGGSSNHFRTAVLRKLGGWDPYNVTEDADLGVRLCRLGYRCAALSSATYEEAPARFLPWLKQRTRWYKGWMQTWLVHMRHPRRLFRELGVAGAVAFQIFLAANVLAALIHPLFMAGFGYTLFALPQPWAKSLLDHAAPIFLTGLLSGYASTILLDIIGLQRRDLLAHAWVLVLTPLHWLLLSLAAWRAVFQLINDPQGWEKTEHGLAKTSRVVRSNPAESKRLRAPRAESMAPLAPVAPMRIMQTPRDSLPIVR